MPRKHFVQQFKCLFVVSWNQTASASTFLFPHERYPGDLVIEDICFQIFLLLVLFAYVESGAWSKVQVNPITGRILQKLVISVLLLIGATIFFCFAKQINVERESVIFLILKFDFSQIRWYLFYFSICCRSTWVFIYFQDKEKIQQKTLAWSACPIGLGFLALAHLMAGHHASVEHHYLGYEAVELFRELEALCGINDTKIIMFLLLVWLGWSVYTFHAFFKRWQSEQRIKK